MRTMRKLAAFGVTWIGVVAGHMLAYPIAHGSPGQRSDHLAATGHASFRVLVVIALAALPVVLVSTAANALRQGDWLPGGPTWRRFALWQVAGFLVLEAVERAGDLPLLLSDPAVSLGLVLQVAVAAIAVWLLGTFARVVLVVAGRRRRRIPAEPPGARVVPVRDPEPVRLTDAPRRAPPLSLAG